MAEQDLASQGAVVDDAHQDDAVADPQNVQTDDTPEPIANLARDLGWTPREEWQGEPDKWKPAEQFIRDGRDIQQTTARELRSVREQMERVTGVTQQMLQDQLAKRDAEWQAKLDQAVEDDDKATVRKLINEKPSANVQTSAPDLTVQRWVADNPWFENHPRAAAVAREISDRLAAQGYDVPTQLKEAEAEVKLRYPDLFGKAAKPPPATQTAASRNPNPSNRAKGFADMPRESQQVALEFERLNNVSKEDFAKSYWANEEKKRVKA